MKKYTIVYADTWQSGSHRHSITRYKRIETDNLKKALKEYDCSVWFVFVGWPELEGESEL